MIKHVVMWCLAATDEAEREAASTEIRAMLESLPSLVPGVRSLEVGENGLPGDKAADIMVIASFDSWTDLRDYAVHPEHIEAAVRIGELTSERRSVDYELD